MREQDNITYSDEDIRGIDNQLQGVSQLVTSNQETTDARLKRLEEGTSISTKARGGNYRSVQKSMWRDKKFRSLSIEERYLFIYLITNGEYTQNYGVCTATTEELCFATKMKEDVLNSSLSKLVDVGMIEINQEYDEILIVNFHKYNWNQHNQSLGKGLYSYSENIQTKRFRDIVQNNIKQVTDYLKSK